MKFASIVEGIGLGLALIGAPFASAGAAEKLVFSNWESYNPPDLFERFTAATGIEVEFTTHATNEEIMGKIVAAGGKGYDVVMVSSPYVEVLANLGYASELDHGQIPKLANLYPEAVNLPHDPGLRYLVPYSWGTTGLCYRPDLTGYDPDSWYDLLRPRDHLKGKITMTQTERWLIGAGLIALGYSVNSTDADEINAARDLLIETKKSLLAFDDTTFYAKLVSGEAALVQAWDGWCNFGIAENPDIKFVVPKEGSDLWVDSMVIMASSEHKEAAHKFIDFVLRPEIHAWVVGNILYKVPNAKAMELVDKELLAAYPNLAMSPADMLKLEALRDLGAAQKLYTRATTEIVSSQ